MVMYFSNLLGLFSSACVTIQLNYHRHHLHHHWQNGSFWAIALLRRFYEIRPSGFRFFRFRSNIFFYRAGRSALRQTPNLEYHVSVFMSPSDRVAQLYSQAPGFFFVAFYDSQGYGGGMPPQLSYYPHHFRSPGFIYRACFEGRIPHVERRFAVSLNGIMVMNDIEGWAEKKDVFEYLICYKPEGRGFDSRWGYWIF
jgi:hypothetical protein